MLDVLQFCAVCPAIKVCPRVEDKARDCFLAALSIRMELPEVIFSSGEYVVTVERIMRIEEEESNGE